MNTKSEPSKGPTSSTENGKPGTKESGKAHDPWSNIEIGGTVLWQADPTEGWFPCTVTGATKDGRLLTLRWRDFPGLKSITVKRHAVALLAIVK